MLRFSTSSSESLTINSLRVALLNYIKSRQMSDTFFLRINDINSSTEAEAQITIDILKKFAIDTENTIYQSKNLSIYQKMAKRLVDEKKAFSCFCHGASHCQCQEIPKAERQKRIQNGEKFSLWIKKPSEDITIIDALQSKIVFKTEAFENILIMDSNGNPSNVFASAIDDMSNNINFIIEEMQKSKFTAESQYIQQQLGYKKKIQYYHIPTLKNRDGSSLTVKTLLEEGYLPDAIINYLLYLSGLKDKDIYYLPDAIEKFNFDAIATQTPIEFSLDILKEFNKKHLKSMDAKKVSSIFGFADSDIGELLKLYLDDASTINELEEYFTPLFQKKACNEREKALSKIILNSPYFKEYGAFKNYLLSQCGLNEEELERSLRKLLTGSEEGPELSKIYNFLKSYLLEVAQCQ